MHFDCYRDHQISHAGTSCLSNMRNMFIVFNIPISDFGNEMLADITDTTNEHIASRNEDTARDRDESDENSVLP